MKHKIDIKYLTAYSSGDCDLGCFNSGEGVIIKVDDKVIYKDEGWASCCDSSYVDMKDVFKVILNHFNIDSEINIDQ